MYLGLIRNDDPDKVEVLGKFGIYLADLEQYNQAIGALEKAVRLDPERDDLRRRLVQVYVAVDRPGDAWSTSIFLTRRRTIPIPSC